jgi:excisionase family DNA binding protein
MTADEVAELLNLKSRLVYSMARAGRIPTIRIGDRYLRFRRDEIERWLSGEADPGVRKEKPPSRPARMPS